jgi:hypothetical protein
MPDIIYGALVNDLEKLLKDGTRHWGGDPALAGWAATTSKLAPMKN